MALIKASIIGFKLAATDHENERSRAELARLEIVWEELITLTVLVCCTTARLFNFTRFKELRSNVEYDNTARILVEDENFF